VHLVSFQILDRQRFKSDVLPKDIVQHDGTIGMGFTMENIKKIGSPKSPQAFEAGWKDTAVMYPGEVTRIIARFDRPGRYVYHCHILSHEDHEMMRAYHIGPWSPELDMPYACHDDHMAKSKEELAGMETLSFASAPNPFNPSTEISFALPKDTHVHLVIYDLRGRVVKVLMEGDQKAGQYDLVWNGQDSSGSAVSSGTYFARLETSFGSAVEKLVLAK
jgi:spore coat protein A